MAGFGNDSIALVTSGLIYSTGTFEERLVSSGLRGDITEITPGIGGSVLMFLSLFL